MPVGFSARVYIYMLLDLSPLTIFFQNCIVLIQSLVEGLLYFSNYYSSFGSPSDVLLK